MKTGRSNYKNTYKRDSHIRSYDRNTSSGRSAKGRSTAAKNIGRSSSSTGRTSVGGYTRATMGSSQAREYGFYESNFGNYNNTSVAQSYDYYYDAEVQVRTQQRHAKRVEKREIKSLNMPKTIASIAVLFAFSLALLCASAVNSSYRGEISAKQAELAEIQEENQYLQSSLEDNIDLNKIAREAEKLGLQKPQAYQITEVQVPNESYTVQYDAKIATQDKSVWEFLKGLLNL